METTVGLPVTLSRAGRSRPRACRPSGRAAPTGDDRLVDESQLALRLGERTARVRDPLQELSPHVRQHVVGLFGQDRGKQSPAGHDRQRNPCPGS